MIQPIPKIAKDERYYIDLAEGHEDWQQIKASYALEGIELTDENAALAGRMIAGEITLAEAMAELNKTHGQPSLKLELVH
jgi:hypothetical protein